MKRSTFALASTLLLLSTTLGCAAEHDADADYEARMASEHAGDEAVPGAAAGDPAQRAVDAEEIAYWPGEEITGYLAWPRKGASRGGIIVIQEWWGLNDNIKTMARRFAQQGYTALAVDLYEGQVGKTRDQALALMQEANGRTARLEDNLRAAHEYLATTVGAAKIGAVGWCFGGGWSLQSAVILGDSLDAAVVYYGRLDADDRLENLAAPILGHFGSEDGGIPLPTVRAFESRMDALGKSITVHVYQEANHAFANPTGRNYDEKAADAAWQRTLDFFATHVGG